MLMSAFCSYQANKYDDAVSTADQYISLHPGSQEVAYAFYLKAISLYEQIVDVGRDQSKTEGALVALQDVVQRFPDTEYARDATLKIDLTQDHLAGKEMAVGRYYLTRGDYIGAINRFRVVVEQYQTTPQIAEALERLTEAYYALGLDSEAQTAAAVLGANYPGTVWYQDAYNILKGPQSEARGRQRLLDQPSFPATILLDSGNRPMLAALTVRDIVLIEQAALEFAPGLNVLTGETGAGKSILLDSLGLAVGGARPRRACGRARRKAPPRPCSILPPRHAARAPAARTGHAGAKARSCCAAASPPTANPAPSSMTKRWAWACCKDLGGLLLEVHGQSDDRGLFDIATHRGLLDAFGGLEDAGARRRRRFTPTGTRRARRWRR